MNLHVLRDLNIDKVQCVTERPLLTLHTPLTVNTREANERISLIFKMQET
jgi:hypothetical protein